MGSIIFAVLGVGGAVSGLLGAIYAALRSTFADRKLRREMSQHAVELSRLEQLKTSLATASPDPSQLAEASRIVRSIAERLDDPDRSNIQKALDQGSNKSKANYIAKLVGD